MDIVSFRLLDRLLDAHDDYPDLPYEFVPAGGGGSPACLLVSEVSHTEAVGGDVVTIRGRNMDRATGVRFVTTGSPVVPILSRSEGTLKFRVPEDITESGSNVKVMWPDRNGAAEVWAPLRFGPSSTEPELPQPTSESSSSASGAGE